MGDSSSGTNIRAECMEMVSGPKKRAVDGADDIGKEAPASKTTAAMRGRATSSVGAYAGMAAARAKLAKEDDDFRSPGEKNKAYVLEFPALRPVTRSRSQGGRSNDKTKDRSPLREEELVTISDLSDDSCDDPRRQYRRERIEATNPPLPRPTTEEGTLTHEETDVVECARKAAHTVLAEAAKSSNLNGVVRGNINAACREIIEAMEYLENRRESDELRKLKADNKRMREQLALLTSETKALRTAFTERNSTSQQVTAGANYAPPLAADRVSRPQQEASQVERRKTKAGKRSASQPEPVQTANTPNQPKAQTKNQKAQPQAQAKAQAKAQHPKAQPKVQLRAVQSIEAQPSTSMTQPATTTQFTWTEVVKKKSKAKEAKKSLQAEQNTNAKKKPTVIKKLTVPKSAAVMITMKPDTDMTYLAAMQKMTSSLKLADIGIESVKVRKSATGARLIEVPGASSARAADDLAERITKVIGDVATVQRPVKTADLRITGFDESVTPEDIKTAIVLKGGCSTENVKVENGPGYVAVKWERIVIIAVYFSPRPLFEFEAFLEGLGRVAGRCAPAQVIVMGDLNAKSAAWGSPYTDPKGEVLRDWTLAAGLEVLNQGNANTCVRRQGGSIVDVTFATPALATRILDWRVLEDVETLSDHLYIRMRVLAQPLASQPQNLGRNTGTRFPRWVISQFDPAMAEEAAIIEAWGDPPPDTAGVEVKAMRFRESLTAVCDAAMPRVRKFPTRQSVYWWSAEIAALRNASNKARRAYTHCRRRRLHTAEEEELLHSALKKAKEALQTAIVKAKDVAFEEFVGTLNRDPWGRPYKMVRNKMKRAPPHGFLGA
ncbi:uncharacterized protein [Choristoneura fumiferana]|uniref:uncharacterized protein n=1 Tax=Choristoneura fumiferana TaxID=7141 RepID=UPI003D157097